MYAEMNRRLFAAQHLRVNIMRAEAEALVENIKQSMGLLRRHL